MVYAITTSPLRPGFTTAPRTKQHHLVHYATLAASSHNTQCWKFRIEENAITVLPDDTRTTPIVDPDGHHLYVSLGCAVQNLEVAAHANGYETVVDTSSPERGTRVLLKESKRVFDEDLFRAIPERQVSRSFYDGIPLTEAELEHLQAAGTGSGVRLILVTEPARMHDILEHIIRANTKQMQNPAFMKELKSWVRFNELDATTSGDGLYGACTGNPQVPRIIGDIIFKFVARASIENKKITKQVNSSAGFAIFVSEKDDPSHWVEAGRCYERFALKATNLGIRNAFLNQPVEEAQTRSRFAKALGLKSTERPDLVVRFGKGPAMPMSPRRRVEEVLV